MADLSSILNKYRSGGGNTGVTGPLGVPNLGGINPAGGIASQAATARPVASPGVNTATPGKPAGMAPTQAPMTPPRPTSPSPGIYGGAFSMGSPQTQQWVPQAGSTSSNPGGLQGGPYVPGAPPQGDSDIPDFAKLAGENHGGGGGGAPASDPLMDSVNSYVMGGLNGTGPDSQGISQDTINALKNELFMGTRGQIDQGVADAGASLSARGLGRSRALQADARLNASQQGAAAYGKGLSGLLSGVEQTNMQARTAARQNALQAALSLIGMRPHGGGGGGGIPDELSSLPTLPDEPGL